MAANASNPFIAYTQPHIEEFKIPAASLYKDSLDAFSKSAQKPKQKVFNNITKLLQESYFVGATKYGNNFIS